MTAVDTTSSGVSEPQRRTEMAASRLPLVDGYRALAATAVVMTHVGFHTGDALNGTWAGVLGRLDAGVAIFFVVSGFLLFRPHAVRHLDGRPAPAVRAYLWRRALRLFPALWLALVGVAVLVPHDAPVPPQTWVAQALLVQTYVPDGQLLGFTQIWSLSTEVAFYLALPLLGVLVSRLSAPTIEQRMRRQVLVLVPLLAVPVVFRLLVHGDVITSQNALFWLPAYTDWFAIGMLLASVSAYRQLRPADDRWTLAEDAAAAPGACWAAAACVAWVATTEVAGPLSLEAPTFWEATFKHSLYAAFATLLLLPGLFGSSGAGLIRTFLGSRPLRFLGQISYGIFLWNMPLLFATYWVFDWELFTGSYPVVLACVYPLTVATATASYYLVERPVLRLKDRVR